MNTQSIAKNKQDAPAVFDWHGLSEVQAILELCRRLNIALGVTPDGRLSAIGNAQAAREYLGDIAPRYKGRVIAHLLGLPAPEVSGNDDRVNILSNILALDQTITDYCCAVGHPPEHLVRLLEARRCMAPCHLLQNLTAFRSWLYAANDSQTDRAAPGILKGIGNER